MSEGVSQGGNESGRECVREGVSQGGSQGGSESGRECVREGARVSGSEKSTLGMRLKCSLGPRSLLSLYHSRTHTI